MLGNSFLRRLLLACSFILSSVMVLKATAPPLYSPCEGDEGAPCQDNYVILDACPGATSSASCEDIPADPPGAMDRGASCKSFVYKNVQTDYFTKSSVNGKGTTACVDEQRWCVKNTKCSWYATNQGGICSSTTEFDAKTSTKKATYFWDDCYE